MVVHAVLPVCCGSTCKQLRHLYFCRQGRTHLKSAVQSCNTSRNHCLFRRPIMHSCSFLSATRPLQSAMVWWVPAVSHWSLTNTIQTWQIWLIIRRTSWCWTLPSRWTSITNWRKASCLRRTGICQHLFWLPRRWVAASAWPTTVSVVTLKLPVLGSDVYTVIKLIVRTIAAYNFNCEIICIMNLGPSNIIHSSLPKRPYICESQEVLSCAWDGMVTAGV